MHGWEVNHLVSLTLVVSHLWCSKCCQVSFGLLCFLSVHALCSSLICFYTAQTWPSHLSDTHSPQNTHLLHLTSPQWPLTSPTKKLWVCLQCVTNVKCLKWLLFSAFPTHRGHCYCIFWRVDVTVLLASTLLCLCVVNSECHWAFKYVSSFSKTFLKISMNKAFSILKWSI